MTTGKEIDKVAFEAGINGTATQALIKGRSREIGSSYGILTVE